MSMTIAQAKSHVLDYKTLEEQETELTPAAALTATKAKVTLTDATGHVVTFTATTAMLAVIAAQLTVDLAAIVDAKEAIEDLFE